MKVIIKQLAIVINLLERICYKMGVEVPSDRASRTVRKGVPFIPKNIEVEYNINDIPDLPDDIEALLDDG